MQSCKAPAIALLSESRTATATMVKYRTETHPARTLGLEARKREQVRCSSLVDWQSTRAGGALCGTAAAHASRVKRSPPRRRQGGRRREIRCGARAAGL